MRVIEGDQIRSGSLCWNIHIFTVIDGDGAISLLPLPPALVTPPAIRHLYKGHPDCEPNYL